jgi:hypothetical protein
MVELDAVRDCILGGRHHVRHQHAVSEQWPASTVIDTTSLSVGETLIRIDALLAAE